MDLLNYCYDYFEIQSNEDTDIYSLLRKNGMSERFIRELYRGNYIRINLKEVENNWLLTKGDILRLYYPKEEVFYENLAEKLDIIFENENYLIINKASGLAVHPTFSRQADTLLNYVGSYFKKNNIKRSVRLVNRLDIETSGIIVVAKNALFQQQLSKELENGNVEKKYYALVEGQVVDSGIINQPISKNPDFSMKREVAEHGQMAITSYKSIASNKDYSLLEVFPLTGRSHQIRVHLSSIGHPLVGDKLYGKENSHLNRCGLHSYSIKFLDSFSNKEVFYKAHLPEDIMDFIKTANLK